MQVFILHHLYVVVADEIVCLFRFVVVVYLGRMFKGKALTGFAIDVGGDERISN